eukprot:scaffold8780_cov130-Isochrysis_galbana.AAC.10
MPPLPLSVLAPGPALWRIWPQLCSSRSLALSQSLAQRALRWRRCPLSVVAVGCGHAVVRAT